MAEFEPGKTYEISHSRKGKFVVTVISVEPPWVHSRIATGEAKMLSQANEPKSEGESLVFRDSLAQIIREIETSSYPRRPI